MKHQGYLASIRYSAETDSFHGRVENLPPGDTVLIEGTSVPELRADFAAQIDLYEEKARMAGREPAPVALEA